MSPLAGVPLSEQRGPANDQEHDSDPAALPGNSWLELPGLVPVMCILQQLDGTDVRCMRSTRRTWAAVVDAVTLRLKPRLGFQVCGICSRILHACCASPGVAACL